MRAVTDVEASSALSRSVAGRPAVRQRTPDDGQRAAEYDQPVETHNLNVGTGSETGSEAVLGIGEKAVAFHGAGRPTAAFARDPNGTTLELYWFDGSSGAKKVDIAKLFDLARAVLAGSSTGPTPPFAPPSIRYPRLMSVRSGQRGGTLMDLYPWVVVSHVFLVFAAFGALVVPAFAMSRIKRQPDRVA